MSISVCVCVCFSPLIQSSSCLKASLPLFWLSARLNNNTTFILWSTNESARGATTWSKIKIKQHKRSCWLVSPQPASCAQVITDCRLQSPVKMNIWADRVWQAGREETTRLSASSLGYITGLSGFSLLGRLLFKTFQITSRAFYFLWKSSVQKKRSGITKAAMKGYTQSSLSLLLGRSALASRQ